MRQLFRMQLESDLRSPISYLVVATSEREACELLRERLMGVRVRVVQVLGKIGDDVFILNS